MTTGFCQKTCPEVFVVEQEAYVIDNAKIEDFEEEIKEAAANCPAEVIKYR